MGGGKFEPVESSVWHYEVSGLKVGSSWLRYRMKDGPSVKQWITLQPGGRTAKNRMTYHRFGVKVATVETEMRRAD